MNTVKIEGKNWDFTYMSIIHVESISFECYFIPHFGGGFAHHVKMFKAWELVAESTSQYWNRTWERWEFQTAILDCLDKYEKQQVKQAKKLNKRLTKLFMNHAF